MRESLPNAKLHHADIPLENWNRLAPELDRLAREHPEVAKQIEFINLPSAEWDTPDRQRVYAEAFTQSGKGINLNPREWSKSWDDLAKERARSVQKGWFPAGTEDPTANITHEFGHLVHGQLEFRGSKQERAKAQHILDLFRTGGKYDKLKGNQISIYAATNEREAFAESFMAARWQQPVSRSPVLHDFIERLGTQPETLAPASLRKARLGRPDAAKAAPEKMAPAKEKAKPIRGEMVEARREGTGKNARIVMADGREAPAHIKPSMVPPQWTDVRVSVHPESELLVTARDTKGRSKMVLSEGYERRSAAIKFNRVTTMIDKHDEITSQILAAQKNPATKEEADVARLMQIQGTRPGSTKDTKAKVKAYGATTLEARHVVQSDDGVRLQFIGKEGIAHDHLIRDEDLAKMLLRRANAALSPDAPIFRTDAEKVRAFTSTLDGGKFSPKDFRTSAATRLADEIVKGSPGQSANLKEHKQRVKVVGERVSRLLGNRPAQALESYIHPEVFKPWTP